MFWSSVCFFSREDDTLWAFNFMPMGDLGEIVLDAKLVLFLKDDESRWDWFLNEEGMFSMVWFTRGGLEGVENWL